MSSNQGELKILSTLHLIVGQDRKEVKQFGSAIFKKKYLFIGRLTWFLMLLTNSLLLLLFERARIF